MASKQRDENDAIEEILVAIKRAGSFQWEHFMLMRKKGLSELGTTRLLSKISPGDRAAHRYYADYLTQKEKESTGSLLTMHITPSSKFR